MIVKASLKTKFFLAFSLIIVLVMAAGVLDLLRQKKAWEENFKEQAVVLGHALNASIGSEEVLQNRRLLQDSIYKLMWLNTNIVQANINYLSAGKLETIASNNTEIIGKTSNSHNLDVLRSDQTVIEKTEIDAKKMLSVTNPISAGGRTVGTYEIFLSLNDLDNTLKKTYIRFALSLIIGVLLAVILGALLLRSLVLMPINKLNKAIKEFGRGNLQYRIHDYPDDEIGKVAKGFNQMSHSLEKRYEQLENLNQQLKERTTELEQLRDNLEEKVGSRTKELRGKVEELEAIQRVTTGRELKMMELKEEIQRLKGQIEKKGKKNA